MKINLKLYAYSVALLLMPYIAMAQQTPKSIDISDQADVIGEVATKTRTTTVLRPKLVIEGDYVAPTMVVAAKEIIFKPGARIVFSDSSANTAGAFFVVAGLITVEDPAKPGIITWASTVPKAPPDRGQAATGAEGAQGNPGLEGKDAPAVTVIVKSIANGGLVVDTSGGTGGPGGIGQTGGTGAAGAQGSPARQARTRGPFGSTIWHPWCEAGPGWGQQGGRGGNGGTGGTGGLGGDGGNVTLVSLPESLSTLFQFIRVNTAAGAGGAGGAGGNPGVGGIGGPEGQLASFCNSAGRNGAPGAFGAPGQPGPKGDPGRSGQPFVSNLTAAQFTSLFDF